MKLLDVVALLEDFPELGLSRRKVEFSDLEGGAYALETLSEVQLIKLYYQPIAENTYGNSMSQIPPDYQSRITL